MPSDSHPVLLVLGGARSGKSRYALQRASQRRNVLFVATATRSDDEMLAKIDRHREDRPQHWTTIEETVDLAGVLRAAGPEQEVAIIDCLTLYAANLLAADGLNPAAELDRLCAALQSPPCDVILVSNEVGSGIVPAYPLGRRYRDLLGEINQRVAAMADEVVLMVAGLPFPLKRQAD